MKGCFSARSRRPGPLTQGEFWGCREGVGGLQYVPHLFPCKIHEINFL